MEPKRSPSKGESMMLEILEGLKRKARVLEFRFENEGIYIKPNRAIYHVADEEIRVVLVGTWVKAQILFGQRVCVFKPGKLHSKHAYKLFKVVLNYFISQPVAVYSPEVAGKFDIFLKLIHTFDAWKKTGRLEGYSYLGGWKVKVNQDGYKYPVPIPREVQSLDAYLAQFLGPENRPEHSWAEALVYRALQQMKNDKLIGSFLMHPRLSIRDGEGIDVTIAPKKIHFPSGDDEVHVQIKRTNETSNVKHYRARHIGQKIAIIKLSRNMTVAHVKMIMRYVLERPVEKIQITSDPGIDAFLAKLHENISISAEKNIEFDYIGNGEWFFQDPSAVD